MDTRRESGAGPHGSRFGDDPHLIFSLSLCLVSDAKGPKPRKRSFKCLAGSWPGRDEPRKRSQAWHGSIKGLGFRPCYRAAASNHRNTAVEPPPPLPRTPAPELLAALAPSDPAATSHPADVLHPSCPSAQTN